MMSPVRSIRDLVPARRSLFGSLLLALALAVMAAVAASGVGDSGTVEAQAPAPGDRNPAQDFEGESGTVGVWAGGDTLWLLNGLEIHGYRMSDKSRDTSRTFDTLSAAGNTLPTGIWSDGDTMWVTNFGLEFPGFPSLSVTPKIFAYKMSDKSRDADKDFDTLDAAGNGAPGGLWSDGVTMWVADLADKKLYAYRMSDKSRDASRDFDALSAAGNDAPKGIWSDGVTMWVADIEDDKIYAYRMSDKSRDADKDFNALSAAGNNDPAGISSDGPTMWVADQDTEDNKVYAYHAFVEPPGAPANLRATANQANRTVTLSWTAPANTGGAPVTGYTITQTGRATATYDPGGAGTTFTTPALAAGDYSFTVAAKNPATGSASNAATAAIEATRPAAPARPVLTPGVGSITATWSAPSDDGGTAITDYDVRYCWYECADVSRWYAWPHDGAATSATITGRLESRKSYHVKVRAWNAEGRSEWSQDASINPKVVQLAAPAAPVLSVRQHPNGDWLKVDWDPPSWSGSRVWEWAIRHSTNGASWTEFTEQATGYVEANIFGIVPGATYFVQVRGRNDAGWGAWSALSYTPPPGPGQRYLTHDFDTLSAAGNTRPTGIWSDGVTMWVADYDDARIYAYKMSDKSREALVKEFTLLGAVGNDRPTGIWSDGETMWVVDATDKKIYAYNMQTKLRDQSKEIDSLAGPAPGDPLGNSWPTGIWSDGVTMWVGDYSTSLIYAYRLADGSRDAGKDITTVRPGDHGHDHACHDDHDDHDDHHDHDHHPLIFQQKAVSAAGIWSAGAILSDGATLWVAAPWDEEVLAYTMTSTATAITSAHDASLDLHTLCDAGNNDPWGIWSDGETMWVADPGDARIYAYRHAAWEPPQPPPPPPPSGWTRGSWNSHTHNWLHEDRPNSPDGITLGPAGEGNPCYIHQHTHGGHDGWGQHWHCKRWPGVGPQRPEPEPPPKQWPPPTPTPAPTPQPAGEWSSHTHSGLGPSGEGAPCSMETHAHSGHDGSVRHWHWHCKR